MSKLIIIPTPIGNLEDASYRSIRILKEVDLVLAEDKRITKRLLAHYKIKTILASYHMFNEHKLIYKVLNLLKSNKKIGLVSDAGMPGISDPGFLLIRECIKQGVSVECLPGPTAFLPALINSAIPYDRFVFEGFLPLKKGRTKRIKELLSETRTMIFYESPHRIIRTLKQFINHFGPERTVSISRELTKVFEENKRGSLEQMLEHYTKHKPKGEFVIVIEGIK